MVLVKIGDKRGIDAALVMMINDLKDKDASVRISAVSALTGIVAKATDITVSTAAGKTLIIAEKTVDITVLQPIVEPLIAALKDPDENVSTGTGLVLLEIAQNTADTTLLQPAIVPLIAALKNRDASVRIMTASVLYHFQFILSRLYDKLSSVKSLGS